MRVILLLIVSLTIQVSYSQNLTGLASNDDEWSEGSIFLTNNSELKGLVRYNDKVGVLNLQSGAQSRSFTPRSVLAFEFFDAAQNKQRLFYSIEYEDSETTAKRPYFFEVLKDYGDFALVSKTDPIEFKKKLTLADQLLNNSQTAPDNNALIPSTTHIYQLETIYLFDLIKEKIDPIAEITNQEIDRLLFDKSKTKDKVVGRSELKDFFQDSYELVADYAKENDLKFDKKDDLVKIFNYYSENIKK
jgi:hypothetical protein